MTSKHTPGPWSYYILSQDYPEAGLRGTPTGISQHEPDDESAATLDIVNFTDEHVCLDIEEQLANAHLIAKAPEMVEVLRDLDEWKTPLTDVAYGDGGSKLLRLIDNARRILREVDGDGVTHRQRCTARVWDNGDMTDCGEVNCEEHAKPVEPATAECRAKVDGLDCNELDRNVDEMCDPCLVFCSANPHLESAQRAAHRALARIDAERERAARAWIPVEERLPEADGLYLTYRSGGLGPHTILWFDADDQKWRPTWTDRFPSHWMPLPEEP